MTMLTSFQVKLAYQALFEDVKVTTLDPEMSAFCDDLLNSADQNCATVKIKIRD